MGRVVWGAALVACCAFVGACWLALWTVETVGELTGFGRTECRVAAWPLSEEMVP